MEFGDTRLRASQQSEVKESYEWMNEPMINQLHFLMFFFLWKAIFRINSKKKSHVALFQNMLKPARYCSFKRFFTLKQRRHDNFQFYILTVRQ